MTEGANPAPIDSDALLDDIRHGRDDAVVAAFRGRAEAERRAVAPRFVALARNFWCDQDNNQVVPFAYDDTGLAAVFACASLTEIKRLKHDHKYGTMCNEVTVAILVDREPTWMTSWATWALDRDASPSGRADGLWTMVRQLILAGVCEPLDTDGYILGMISGLDPHGYESRTRWFGVSELGIARDDATIDAFQRGRRWTLVGALRDDPRLLEREIWRLFEVPGRPSRQLFWSPGQPDPWIEALVHLANDRDIERSRLLAACLDAMARDITRHQSTWFAALWWALAPTDEERRIAQDRLLHLLAHPVSSIVGFALDQLERIEQGGELDTSAFRSEIESVLITMPVVICDRALRLLDRVVVADPNQASTALVAATAGLLHSHPKVRASATKLLVRHVLTHDAAVGTAIAGSIAALEPEEARALEAVLDARPRPSGVPMS